MKYYIQDNTIGQAVYFENVADLVTYLEGLSKKSFNLTRNQFMDTLVSLGHGYDDNDGVVFTRAMSEHFNIGIIKNDKHVLCDVHAASSFNKEEYGD